VLKGWRDRLVNTPKKQKLLQRERTLDNVTQLICSIMIRDGVSRTELATRLDVTLWYLDLLLEGEVTVTVEVLSDILYTLGYAMEVKAVRLQG